MKLASNAAKDIALPRTSEVMRPKQEVIIRGTRVRQLPSHGEYTELAYGVEMVNFVHVVRLFKCVPIASLASEPVGLVDKLLISRV